MIAPGRSLIPLLIVCSCCVAQAIIKEWRPLDADWSNRNNWDGGLLPCSTSRVVLPEDVVVSVFVNGTVSWRELVMPQTGELVLGKVTFAMDGPCQVGEAKFKRWQASSWFDPDRWTPSQEQALAVPHSERIPCAHDAVHLSDERALALDFNRIHSITVGQVKYGDKSLTAGEWRSRLASEDWRYQILNPPHNAFINGTECDEPLGCLCDHDVNIMQMVCSNAGTLCSEQLECSDGFRPPGHCCDMCGAMMKLTVDEGTFTKSALDRLVSSMLKDEPATQSYSYRTARNVIHLTIVDNTTNERSILIANKVQDYLLKDKADRNLYGILTLEVFRSGPSHSPAHHLSPEEWRLIMSNLASTFVTFIILGLVGAGLYYYKGHGKEDMTVSFARFQNDTGNVEIAIDTQTVSTETINVEEQSQETVQSPYAETPEIPSTTAASKTPTTWKKITRAFVNPLFGEPSANRMSGRWSMSSLMKSVATQENPIFDLDEARSDINVESSDTPCEIDDDRSETVPEADATASDEHNMPEELPAIPEEGQSTEKGERKLKKLWKKATRKFASESASASPNSPPSEETQESSDRFFQLNQRREDEVVLTEETDE